MERFGEALREERESRGVTLESISATTRVALRHLENLEADEYGQLPGGVFRKGIARNYISALGLEEGPWIERFESNLRRLGITTETEGDISEFARNVKRSRGAAETGMGLRWLGVLLLLALVGAGGWAAWKYVLHARLHF